MKAASVEFRQAIILFKAMVPCYSIQQQFGLVGNLKLKPF